MKRETKVYLAAVEHYKDRLTLQQYRTLRGQVYKGDFEGMKKGLVTILKKA